MSTIKILRFNLKNTLTMQLQGVNRLLLYYLNVCNITPNQTFNRQNFLCDLIEINRIDALCNN